MTTVQIARNSKVLESTALVAADDSVWVAVTVRWWDLASILWWWLCPSDRKAWVTLRLHDAPAVRTRAIRIANRHVRIGSVARLR